MFGQGTARAHDRRRAGPRAGSHPRWDAVEWVYPFGLCGQGAPLPAACETPWEDAVTEPRTEIATLAGGCFWCLEAVFERLQGVERVVSGYSGGRTDSPSYREVCSGDSGHAEVIQVTFDPVAIPYRDVLAFFFAFHDPTTKNRQGADVGTQYRSAIFWHSPEQEQAARAVISGLTAERVFPGPIVTELTPFEAFHPAEREHQGYFQRNAEQPYCQAVIAPKVAKLRAHFAARLRESPAGR